MLSLAFCWNSNPLIFPTHVPEVIELQEMHDMLYETAQAWYKEAEAKGFTKGFAIGFAVGLKEAESVAWEEPEQPDLHRNFVFWLLRVLLSNNLPGAQLPEIIELQELHDMLYETVQAWCEEAEAKGFAEGFAIGFAIGLKEGKSVVRAKKKLPEVIELQEMHDMLYETAQGWYKEAEAKGRKKGEKKGKSEMLIPLLETKFGTLDAGVYTRIHGLDSAELQACSKRLFSAQTVEEVLGKTH